MGNAIVAMISAAILYAAVFVLALGLLGIGIAIGMAVGL